MWEVCSDSLTMYIFTFYCIQLVGRKSFPSISLHLSMCQSLPSCLAAYLQPLKMVRWCYDKITRYNRSVIKNSKHIVKDNWSRSSYSVLTDLLATRKNANKSTLNVACWWWGWLRDSSCWRLDITLCTFLQWFPPTCCITSGQRVDNTLIFSAANRSIGEVVQSRRRPLLAGS